MMPHGDAVGRAGWYRLQPAANAAHHRVNPKLQRLMPLWVLLLGIQLLDVKDTICRTTWSFVSGRQCHAMTW
jgi:hypothetical protein